MPTIIILAQDDLYLPSGEMTASPERLHNEHVGELMQVDKSLEDSNVEFIPARTRIKQCLTHQATSNYAITLKLFEFCILCNVYGAIKVSLKRTSKCTRSNATWKNINQHKHLFFHFIWYLIHVLLIPYNFHIYHQMQFLPLYFIMFSAMHCLLHSIQATQISIRSRFQIIAFSPSIPVLYSQNKCLLSPIFTFLQGSPQLPAYWGPRPRTRSRLYPRECSSTSRVPSGIPGPEITGMCHIAITNNLYKVIYVIDGAYI